MAMLKSCMWSDESQFERKASCIATQLCVCQREYEPESLLVVHYSW